MTQHTPRQRASFTLRLMLVITFLFIAVIQFGACDMPTGTFTTSIWANHLPDNKTYLFERGGEFYSVSLESTPSGRLIVCHYCLSEPLELEKIVEDTMEVPTEKERTNRKRMGNLEIIAWYNVVKGATGGVMLGAEEVRSKPLRFLRVGRVIESKEDFCEAIQNANRTYSWERSYLEELREHGTVTVPYPTMADMQNIVPPLQKVVLVKYNTRKEAFKKKEILIVFANPSEEHPKKKNGKLYKWHSIKKIDEERYRLISEGANELYELEGIARPKEIDLSKPSKNKQIIEIDGLRLPWSFESDETAGYILYDARSIIIETTEFSTFEEYLKEFEKVEWTFPDM